MKGPGETYGLDLACTFIYRFEWRNLACAAFQDFNKTVPICRTNEPSSDRRLRPFVRRINVRKINVRKRTAASSKNVFCSDKKKFFSSCSRACPRKVDPAARSGMDIYNFFNVCPFQITFMGDTYTINTLLYIFSQTTFEYKNKHFRLIMFNGLWLLSCMEVSLKENNCFFLLRIKLHALIWLGVSRPCFDTGAWNGVLPPKWHTTSRKWLNFISIRFLDFSACSGSRIWPLPCRSETGERCFTLNTKDKNWSFFAFQESLFLFM
jgi:hypothetical protein